MMTVEQINRAAALIESLAECDKTIAEIAAATEISLYARKDGSPAADFKRSRAKNQPWSDEHGATLQQFLLGRYRASRAKIARELKQLDVAVPEAPQ
jgi:hypothetical protein